MIEVDVPLEKVSEPGMARRRRKNQSWERTQRVDANKESRTWSFELKDRFPDSDPNEDCDGVSTEDYGVERGTGEPSNPLGGASVNSVDGELQYRSQYRRWEKANDRRSRGLQFRHLNQETGQIEYRFCSNRAPTGEWQAFREPVIATAQLHCYDSDHNLAKSIVFREYEPGASFQIAVVLDPSVPGGPNLGQPLNVWEWIGDPLPSQENKRHLKTLSPSGGRFSFSPTEDVNALSVSARNPALAFESEDPSIPSYPDGVQDALWFATEGAKPDFNGVEVITLTCRWFDPP